MDLAEILVTHLSPSLMVFMAMDIYGSKPWHIPGGIGYDCFVSSSPPIFRVDMERLFFDGPPWFSWFIPPFCCRFIAKFACFIPSCCDDLQPLFDALSCRCTQCLIIYKVYLVFHRKHDPHPHHTKAPIARCPPLKPSLWEAIWRRVGMDYSLLSIVHDC